MEAITSRNAAGATTSITRTRRAFTAAVELRATITQELVTDMVDLCQCVLCGDCRGTGNAWETIRGQYLGSHRMDDTDDLISCPSCEGSGVSEVCDYCLDGEEEVFSHD